MADAEKKVLEKLGRLHTALREQQAKCYAITEEIGQLLVGGPGIGEVLKQLEATFERHWAARYPGGRYVWTYAKDRPQWKRLLARISSDELDARLVNYFRDSDQFVVKARHSFALFVSQVNRYGDAGHATTQDDLDLETPGDCKHQPRCKSEQEHTRRRGAERRGEWDLKVVTP